MPILNRDFGDSGELFDYSPTGKKRMVVNQRASHERINNRIVKQMRAANVAKRMGGKQTIPNIIKR